MNQRSRQTILMAALILTSLAPGVSSGVDLTISQRKLTPAELFKRCYSHVTQLHLSLSHPLRASVVAGTLSPVDACMRVLAGANLNSSGLIATTTSVNGVNESLAVLRSFGIFHHTLTQNPEIDGSIPNASEARGTRFIIDEGEFGLHFTRALFTPGANASDIVKLPVGVEAIRSAGPSSSFTSYVAGTPFTITIPTVQTGNFMGVRLISASPEKANLTRSFDNHTYPIHESAGGGVIGTPAFLTSNFGRAEEERMNGGVVMPRRLSRAIYKDLLCRDLPVIRQTDGAAFVENQPTAITPAFRKGTSCMACHASMDPMAGVARNLMFMWDRHNPDTTNMMHLRKYPVTLAAETGMVEADPNFYQRPTNGKLFFRSYDGSLIDRPVSSIADLGARIAETNDFYACTAARYYKFFTGISVNLQDSGDTLLPAIPAGDLFYRNEVIRLGQSLKSSQNLQTLIREIMSSDVYQRASNRGSQ